MLLMHGANMKITKICFCTFIKNYVTFEFYQNTTIFVFRHVTYRISGVSVFITLRLVFSHTTQNSEFFTVQQMMTTILMQKLLVKNNKNYFNNENEIQTRTKNV